MSTDKDLANQTHPSSYMVFVVLVLVLAHSVALTELEAILLPMHY